MYIGNVACPLPLPGSKTLAMQQAHAESTLQILQIPKSWIFRNANTVATSGQVNIKFQSYGRITAFQHGRFHINTLNQAKINSSTFIFLFYIALSNGSNLVLGNCWASDANCGSG